MKTPEGDEIHFDELPPLPEVPVPRLDVQQYCGQWAWQNGDGDRFPFLCGSASCGRTECKQIYYTRRIRLISSLIEEYKLNKFFTLTLDRRKVNEETAWQEIQYIWNKMRTILKRKYPSFKFVAVLEQHKDDRYPHIHGFTNTWIPQSEWSKHWDNCGGGPITDVRAVTGKAEEYVSKELHAALYVGKQNLLDARSRLEGRQRSIWRSTKMKAKFELAEKDPNWLLLKRAIFKEVPPNGTETGEFVERARGAVSLPRTETGVENVETKVEATEPGEDQGATEEARGDQRSDQKRKE